MAQWPLRRDASPVMPKSGILERVPFLADAPAVARRLAAADWPSRPAQTRASEPGQLYERSPSRLRRPPVGSSLCPANLPPTLALQALDRRRRDRRRRRGRQDHGRPHHDARRHLVGRPYPRSRDKGGRPMLINNHAPYGAGFESRA